MLRVDGVKMLDSELYKAYFENGSSVMQRMPIEAGSTYAPLKILHSLYITEVYNIVSISDLLLMPTVNSSVIFEGAVASWCNPADSWCQKLSVARVQAQPR